MKYLKRNINTTQEKTSNFLLLTIFVLATVYCILLISIIFSVIEQKKNNVASAGVSSELTITENKYASRIALLNESEILNLNYKHISSTSFAVRKDNISSYVFLYEH